MEVIFEQELGVCGIRIWTYRENYGFSCSIGEGMKGSRGCLSKVTDAQKDMVHVLDSLHLPPRVNICPSLPCSVLWEDGFYILSHSGSLAFCCPNVFGRWGAPA